ncbi:hypothetical protein ACJ72_03645 [Emergomyces africanus]|uniref:Uncharacterized protein n=1 Tax=Emergomyces africanus TaxID=1955775 RepID=A0A1B7NZF7_9EURO|nr:hypothetical protein ACJ72_03645 [Emergomyces africanus]
MPERLTSTQNLVTVGLRVENLSPQHFEILQQAFWTILSTDLATETFAQVVDGRPKRDVYRDYFNEFRKSFQNNMHPSNAALEAVEACRRNLNLGNSTQISAELAQAFQNTHPGSREFHLRLIEILAVLFHGIAVHDGGFHKPEAPDPIIWHEELFPNMPPPPPPPPAGSQPPGGIRFKAEEYARRVDETYAMDMNIYCDRYERIIPERRARCVIRGEDLPGYAQAMEDWARRTGNG